ALIQIPVYALFFFSSRRRHTRFKCDWSSDVCSSDLMFHRLVGGIGLAPQSGTPSVFRGLFSGRVVMGYTWAAVALMAATISIGIDRKERRVGKGCRSRGGPWD